MRGSLGPTFLSDYITTPALLPGGKKFAGIAGGGEHFIGVLTDGSFVGAGRTDGNQTGAGRGNDLTEPTAQIPPSYAFSPASATLSIPQGGTKTTTFTISPTDGGFSRAGLLKFSGTVSVTPEMSPGITVTISPSSVLVNQPTAITVTVSVASSAALGPAGGIINGSPQIGEFKQTAGLSINVTSPPPPGGGSFTCTSESSAVADGYQCVTYSGKTTLVKYAVPELIGTWVDRSAGVCFNWKEDGQATVRYQGGGLLGGAARTTASGRWGAIAASNGAFYPNPTQWYIYTAQADDQTKLLGYDSGTNQIVGWSFTKEGSCPW
jgi:hypothetical protein